MAESDTIEIADRATFPAKITAIRGAANALRAFGDDLGRIVAQADKEAASFTTGSPAPIYADLLAGLRVWHSAVNPAIAAVCDSAGNCADTAQDKFTAITGIDDAAAAKVKNI